MKYLYIENYLKISKEQKRNFLNTMNRSEEFKISNEKIIFSEESLLLGLLKDSNVQKAYEYFKNYFKEIKDINIDIIQSSFDKSNHTVLTFTYPYRQIRV